MVLEWFINFGTLHEYLVYGVIIFVSFIEGPILAVVAGLLLRTGYLSVIPVYVALMVGDLIGDIFWYWMGRNYGHHVTEKLGKYVGITEGRIRFIERLFHNHTYKILLISKLTMGFGFAVVTLVTAGIVKIPFKTYMIINTAGQIVWTALLLVVGYFLGHMYLTFDDYFSRFSTITIGILIVIGLFQYGKFVRRYLAQRSRLE